MFAQFQTAVNELERKQGTFEGLYHKLKIIARSRMAGERAI